MGWFKSVVNCVKNVAKVVTDPVGTVAGLFGGGGGGGGGGGTTTRYVDTGAAKKAQIEANAKVAIEKEKASVEKAKLEAQKHKELMAAKQREYDRQHAITMANIQKEAERQAKEHEAKLQQERQAHAQRMEKMAIDKEEKDTAVRIKQKEDGINACNAEITKLDTLLKDDSKVLQICQKELEKAMKTLDAKQLWLDAFENYKKAELVKVSDKYQLASLKTKFEQNDEQIMDAIEKCGQIEENVGKFLTMTHHLLTATVATTANANKLQVQISVFDELMRRECNGKLLIEQYFFQNNLSRLTPILAACKSKYVNVEGIICKEWEEFEDIICAIQKGLKRQQRKQLQANNSPNQPQLALGNGDDEKNNDDEDDFSEEEEEEEEVQLKGEELAVKLLTDWGLMKKWEAMLENDWDDPAYWKDLVNDEDELKKCGFKGGAKAKFIGRYEEWLMDNKPVSEEKRKLLKLQEKCPLITFKELNTMYPICFNPETWLPLQREQTECVKEGLTEFSPVLGDFFFAIHKGIKQSQNYLSYEITDSNEQRRAIKMAQNMAPRMIEYKAEDAEENEVKNEDGFFDEMRKEWQKGSKVEIFSQSDNKWCKGEIISIVEDDEGEWLNVRYGANMSKQVGRFSEIVRPALNANDKTMAIALNCRALRDAAIVKINVTDSMMTRFNANAVTLRALTIALGVEDCCMQIIKSQGTIRQSYFLAKELLNMKPSKISAKGKELWGAVDDGIIRIFKNAIEMDKAAAQYFGFFLRFRQSFLRFDSNKDKALAVSLRDLNRDCRQFGEFKKEFDAKVKMLSDEALRVIQKCVRNVSGADKFEDARITREKALKAWLDKKAIYDQRALDLDEEFDKVQIEKINIAAEKARLKCVCDMMSAQIASYRADKKGYVETKAKLEKMVIGNTK